MERAGLSMLCTSAIWPIWQIKQVKYAWLKRTIISIDPPVRAKKAAGRRQRQMADIPFTSISTRKLMFQ